MKMYPRIILHLTLLAIVSGSAPVSSVAQNASGFRMRILFTTDMHTSFDPISESRTDCANGNATSLECYKSFARLATLIRREKKNDNSTIFLNAGDTYLGTEFDTSHKWRTVYKFLNMLQPNATTLGICDYNKTTKDRILSLNATNLPVTTANVNFTGPGLIKKSVLLEMKGHKVGIIGFFTTKSTDNFRDNTSSEVLKAVQEEVNKLQADGVNIIIALGHSRKEIDEDIAMKIEGIDLVIGSHTSHYPQSLDDGKDLNPKEFTAGKNSKKIAHWVETYGYTKYLGNLIIDFNSTGQIEKVTSNPILIDDKIEPATDVLQELTNEKVVGKTKIELEGETCRSKECKFGNVITDAMLYYDRNHNSKKSRIAFINARSIVRSIEKRPDGQITMGDVRAALLSNKVVEKTTLSGKELQAALELCAQTLTNKGTSQPLGPFLQFSGMKVTYDLSKASGSRVVSVSVRKEYGSTDYEKLDLKKEYEVQSVDFASNGTDDFSMLKNLIWKPLNVTLDAILVDYLQHQKEPINPTIERWTEVKPTNKPTESSIRSTESSTIGAITQKANSGYRAMQAIAAMIVLPIFALVFVS